MPDEFPQQQPIQPPAGSQPQAPESAHPSQPAPGPSDPTTAGSKPPQDPIDQNAQPGESTAPFPEASGKYNIFAILGFIFIFIPGLSLIGLIFCIVALVQVSHNASQKGKGLAIAGLIIFLVSTILMVALFYIGAVAYFGVLEPTVFLPDRCSFGSQVICRTDQMTITDQPDLTMAAAVINNFGGDVMIYDGSVESSVSGLGDISKGCNLCFTELQNMKCENPADNPSSGHTDPTYGGTYLWNAKGSGSEALSSDEAVIWPEGESRALIVSCDNAENLPKGEQLKFTVNMKYFFTTADAQYARQISGEVFSAVQ